jgi:hypothetical protein
MSAIGTKRRIALREQLDRKRGIADTAMIASGNRHDVDDPSTTSVARPPPLFCNFPGLVPLYLHPGGEMENAMAELINLKGADDALRRAEGYMAKFKSSVIEKRANNLGVTWTNQQLDDLINLYQGVVGLYGAIIEIMHNNRDGRGGADSSRRR